MVLETVIFQAREIVGMRKEWIVQPVFSGFFHSRQPEDFVAGIENPRRRLLVNRWQLVVNRRQLMVNQSVTDSNS